MANIINSSSLFWVPTEDGELFAKAELINDKDQDIYSSSSNNKEQRVTLKKLSNNEIFTCSINSISPVNPIIFDKVNDMSELTHLNEPSVLYNLQNRYFDNLIYTYSGLFLVAINPYNDKLNLYTDSMISKYHNTSLESNDDEKTILPPHIYNITENAYQSLLKDDKNQSILVTGESGAGKTENTKKILQYLTSITKNESTNHNFEAKILQSNPILESFGNAQTVRNNNSSRFGKFIKIKISNNEKHIIGAQIDWYLLEKSRIINQTIKERNFHIFYELLAGLNNSNHLNLKSNLLIDSTDFSDYQILNNISNSNDLTNFESLMTAFKTIGFQNSDVENIFKIVSTILHVGNLKFTNFDNKNNDKPAVLENPELLEKITTLLGLNDINDFKDSILKPKSKAGREWVSKSKNHLQSKSILNALSRNLYENLFNYIVNKINDNLNSNNNVNTNLDCNYIGLLDIAGFEIFEKNSFEQFCINYTNEKLQQFFNYHMFILEQNEYLNENIEWDYINFGKDLQSTIDLIEVKKTSPTGILPLLDEESIIPNSSDESFYQKLITNWDNYQQKSGTDVGNKFKRSKKLNCFILKHYAGQVEYDTEGWLSKNKDPLNEHLLTVLSKSSNHLISSFFATDCFNNNSIKVTTSSRHRDQLFSLLEQLKLTNPHFVRCIIPNNSKTSNNFDKKLILDQLRCNGVLEGIRIAREGYPNRILFSEFFQRYKFLLNSKKVDSVGDSNLKNNCEILVSTILNIESTLYKVGSTKLFFKAGVLAELELKIDEKLSIVTNRLNSVIRGEQIRSEVTAQLARLHASRMIGSTFEMYNEQIQNNAWFKLYIKLKPLLSSSQDIIKNKKFKESLDMLEGELSITQTENSSLKEENILKGSQLEEIQMLLKQETMKLNNQKELLSNTKDQQVKLKEQVEDLKSINTTLTENKETANKGYEESLSKIEVLEKLLKETETNLKKQFDNDKSNLTNKIENLKLKLSENEQSSSDIVKSSDILMAKISKLAELDISQTEEIKSLKAQLANSQDNVNTKLINLERSCNTAMTRLKTLVGENTDLRTQISILKKEQSSMANQLKLKESQLVTFKEKINTNQSEMNSICEQRDNVLLENSNVLAELKETRIKLTDSVLKYQTLEKEYATLNNLPALVPIVDEAKIVELENRLAQEISLNNYLNEKLISIKNERHTSTELQNSKMMKSEMNTTELLYSLEVMRLKLNESARNIEKEIEEKKDLISKLRFTETKLASSTFDLQSTSSQIKKLKEIINNSNLRIDLEKELKGTNDSSDVNIERLVLEVQHLKRQLDIETKARYDAENATSALHNKFNKIQEMDSSSDIFRLKYEASEERVKALQNKLRGAGPLKDRTNLPLPTGEIFMQRESISKFEDEVRFHKLENYKLQEVLSDSDNKISNLIHQVNQANSKEVLLAEQIIRLQKDLDSTERHNEVLNSTMKQQKQQYENCLTDLHETENQLREYSHALAQAEEDIKNMADIIEKLKSSKKQNDKLIWERETERNDLSMQLQEDSLELKKAQNTINLLYSDLTHLKERLSFNEDKSLVFEEIEDLKRKISQYVKSETQLKKEISTLKYTLETTENDFEIKITDLVKQIDHYSNMLKQLSEDKDLIYASEQNISKEYDSLNHKANHLSQTINELSRDKTQLQEETIRLKTVLDDATASLEKASLERTELLNRVKYLEETVHLQKEQSERNEEFVTKTQSDLSEYRSNFDGEKQKNIDLFEENQTIIKLNDQLNQKIESLETQLGDTSEKDAWLNKIHELEALVSSETELKYEEIKKSTKLERIIQELEECNKKQTGSIDMANMDRERFEDDIQHYSEKINNYEKQISKQQVDMNKMVRDNSYFENRVDELEREAKYWQERFNALSSNQAQIRLSQEEIII